MRPVKYPLDLHVQRDKESATWKRDGGGDEMEGGEIMHDPTKYGLFIIKYFLTFGGLIAEPVLKRILQ